MSNLTHRYPAKVERVVDGDTVVATVYLGFGLQKNGVRLRLFGINTAELKSKVVAEKKAALTAKDFMIAQVEGKAIEVEVSKTKTGEDLIDSFGRYISTVYLDGKSINEEMLSLGFAVPYKEKK